MRGGERDGDSCIGWFLAYGERSVIVQDDDVSIFGGVADATFKVGSAGLTRKYG